MNIKNAIARVEKISSLLFAVKELKEGRRVLAVKMLSSLTGLSVREVANAIAFACGEKPQGEVSEEAREVGLLLKKLL